MRANLIVRSLDGRIDLPIAKTVEYRGDQIVHAYVYSKYQKHSIHAWGIRYPLIHWMHKQGIQHLYYWDSKESLTHHIDLDTIGGLGTVGEQDQFGGTLNVPREEWDVHNFKLPLPWVADQHKLVLPQCVQPWPLVATEPSQKELFT